MVTSASPPSGDVKVIVVDWVRGLGKAVVEFCVGGVEATALELKSERERCQTEADHDPAKIYEPSTANE